MEPEVQRLIVQGRSGTISNCEESRVWCGKCRQLLAQTNELHAANFQEIMDAMLNAHDFDDRVQPELTRNKVLSKACDYLESHLN